MQKKLTSLCFYLDNLKTLIQPLVKKLQRVWTFQVGLLKNYEIVMLKESISFTISLVVIIALKALALGVLKKPKMLFWHTKRRKRTSLCFYLDILKTLRSVWIQLIFSETENWKYCSKIIFKCVNNIVRPIFNIFKYMNSTATVHE